jgi:hypothetical protein
MRRMPSPTKIGATECDSSNYQLSVITYDRENYDP